MGKMQEEEYLTGEQTLILDDIRAERTLGQIARTLNCSIRTASSKVIAIRARWGCIEHVQGEGFGALYRIIPEKLPS